MYVHRYMYVHTYIYMYVQEVRIHMDVCQRYLVSPTQNGQGIKTSALSMHQISE